jgi:biopolymer transport protein ExbD
VNTQTTPFAGVRYPDLVEVMDGAKRAGALTVALAIEPAP